MIERYAFERGGKFKTVTLESEYSIRGANVTDSANMINSANIVNSVDII